MGEKFLDLALLGGAQHARFEVINEVAIALVGRHSTGRGVGLGEIALALERDHFGAHGRGDTARSALAATEDEPTGWAVSTCSTTTASRMVALRASRFEGFGVTLTRRAIPSPC